MKTIKCEGTRVDNRSKTEGCLPCSANSVSESAAPSFEAGEAAWKAGTLPPELLPPNYIYSSLKSCLCKEHLSILHYP